MRSGGSLANQVPLRFPSPSVEKNCGQKERVAMLERRWKGRKEAKGVRGRVHVVVVGEEKINVIFLPIVKASVLGLMVV